MLTRPLSYIISGDLAMNSLFTGLKRLSISPPSCIAQLERSMATVTRSGRYVLTKTTGHSYNVHRSNRAKEGLYHGADVRFGNSISHSVKHSKRRWNPNVQSKRVYSFALQGMIRFKMTTKAMKAIDDAGGIDNYLLQLDEKLIQDSNYLIKIRGLIANKLYYQNELDSKYIKKMGWMKHAPPQLNIYQDETSGKWQCTVMESIGQDA